MAKDILYCREEWVLGAKGIKYSGLNTRSVSIFIGDEKIL